MGSCSVHLERAMFPPGAQVGFKLPEARPGLIAAEVEAADTSLVVDFCAGAAIARPRNGRRTRS